MKKYFITGLVLLLPVTLTLAIAIFIFNLLTIPFAGALKAALNHYDLLENGLLFLNADDARQFVSQALVLLFLFFFTVFLGWLARWFFIHYLLNFWENVALRIPFISSVYKTSKDVIKTIFGSETRSFKQVVLAPFPHPGVQSVGLVTREDLPGPPHDPDAKMAAVFLPTTPNPTSGFLILYRQEDLVYLDMKVEDAFKYVISCGVIASPFRADLTSEKTISLAVENL